MSTDVEPSQADMTCAQLPFWPLLVLILGLAAIAVFAGELIAIICTLVGFALFTQLPTNARFSHTNSMLVVTGWLGTPALPRTSRLSHEGLTVQSTTHAGEGNNCVHTLTIANANHRVQLLGLRCSPQELSALVARLSPPKTAAP